MLVEPAHVYLFASVGMVDRSVFVCIIVSFWKSELPNLARDMNMKISLGRTLIRSFLKHTHTHIHTTEVLYQQQEKSLWLTTTKMKKEKKITVLCVHNFHDKDKQKKTVAVK